MRFMRDGGGRADFGFLALLLALLLPLAAPAQITITGVTDRYYNYSDTVTFTVAPQAGYSYFALLDTNRVPTGVPVTVSQVDYHELRVAATNLTTGTVTNALVRFIVQSSVRNAKGSAENGLPPWTPWPIINATASEFAGAHLRVIAPESFPVGYEIPVVAWVENDAGHAVRANGMLAATGQPSIQLRRGVGSGFLPAVTVGGTVNYDAGVGGLAAPKSIAAEAVTAWTAVSGTLSGSNSWPAGSRIAITNTLTLPAGASLTVGAASVVRLSPGVNVNLNGQLTVNGTTDRPVVFMPVSRAQPWGGFFLSASASQVLATGTIFTGSGSGPSGGAGHRSEQCLFFCTNYATVKLTDCALIDLAGQVGHSFDMGGAARYFFTFDHVLIQDAITTGEFTDAVFNVNDSAFIEFFKPPPPFSTFNDGDEDALYIWNIPTGYASGFTNTLFGWTRDDGVDSGGSGSGVLNFQRCWFESIYHEGNSLSGVRSSSAHADKIVTHTDDVFLGVGQGIENGYGAVTNRVDHCLMIGNLSGVRFGDNYNWSYYGRTVATNSILLNNYRDVWGMTWQTDTSGAYEGWRYRTNQMDVRGNFLTTPNPNHPANSIWNPAADAWRLTAFLTTPPAAPVGISFATWTNQFDLATLFSGVPVGLSTFTTNAVSVDFAFVTASNATLATGTLAFAPGETVKRIFPAGFDAAAVSQVRVVLGNPVMAELTGETNVLFAGSVPTPVVSCWLAGNQLDFGRIGEGVPLKLSGPSAQPVTVQYEFAGSAGDIQSGVATFAPGETVKWVTLPGGVSAQEQLVRFSLSNPAGASLGSASNVFFVKTIAAASSAPVTLLPRGAVWKYYDTVTNAVAGWAATNFNDTGWSNGPAPLGYNGSPAQVTTVGFGPSSSAKYITTYFRTPLVVTNAASLVSLTFNLLRDDGAVIYLNGAEVYREAMPSGTITYTNLASATVSGTANWTTQTFATSALTQPLRSGTNLLAAEIHQVLPGSSDILFNLEVIGTSSSGTPPQPLCSARFDNQFTLAWGDPSFGLQVATNLAGPWISVATNSPVFPNPTAAQQFFRLLKP